MLLTLNRKHGRQQAVIVLLLVLAITPNNDDPCFPDCFLFCIGLQCFSCAGADCDKNQQPKDCGENMGACVTSGPPGNLTGDCSSTTKADCIKGQNYGFDCYYPTSDNNKTLLEKINKCIEDNKEEGETVSPVNDQGLTCTCRYDACNLFGDLPNLHNASDGHERDGASMCYVCRGDSSSPCWEPDLNAIIPIKDKCGGCWKSKSAYEVTRDCIDGVTYHCSSILRDRKRWNCYNNRDAGAEKFGYGDFKQCLTEQGKPGHKEVPNITGIQFCMCRGHLCNPAGRIFARGSLIFFAIVLAKCFIF